MPRSRRRFLLILAVGVIGAGTAIGLACLRQGEIRVVEKWHDNGQAKEVSVYERDILGRREKVKELVYFESGSKECEVDYKHGKVNGLARMWYESDQLYIEATYRNNRPHGVRLAYHENGQLFCRAEYEDGKLLRRRNWDEEGNEIYLDMDRPGPF